MKHLNFTDWLIANKDNLLALYSEYQYETGDEDTSLQEFCGTLYTETRHYQQET